MIVIQNLLSLQQLLLVLLLLLLLHSEHLLDLLLLALELLGRLVQIMTLSERSLSSRSILHVLWLRQQSQVIGHVHILRVLTLPQGVLLARRHAKLRKLLCVVMPLLHFL